MKDLTNGNEAKLLVLFSLPMLLGNVFQQLYNLVDSVIVGKYVGKQALAAVGQAFPVIFVSVALVMGFGMAGNILIAQYYGAKNMERVKAAVDTTLTIIMRFALGVTVIGFLLTPWILSLMGTPADVMKDAVLYLRIIFAGSLVSFGYNGISAVLRGLGDSRTPLYALIIATIVNIILDLLFVIGFKWGVAGVGYATLIAQAVAFIWTVLYLNRKNPAIKIDFLRLVFDKPIFRETLRIGLPSGIQQGLVGAGLMALTSVVNRFGTNPAAAFSAASKLDSFTIMPAMNIGMAISTFTGQNLGAGRRDRVRNGLIAGLVLALLITGTMSVVLLLAGDSLIGLFTTDPEVIRIGYEYLRIVALGYLFQTIMFTFMGVVRGAGEAVFPMLMTLTAMWLVRIPLAYYLSSRWGTRGIWWALVIGFIVGAAGSVLYYFFGPWHKKVLVKPSEHR